MPRGQVFIWNKEKVSQKFKRLNLLFDTPKINGRNNTIPLITLKETSKKANALKVLSENIHEFLPTVIFYQPEDSDGIMLLSIPKNSNFTEVNHEFSKQIRTLHSFFFKPPK